jgi:hypothetical protein
MMMNSLMCTLQQILGQRDLREWAIYYIYRRDEKCIHKFLSQDLEERRHLIDLGIDGRVLKLALKKIQVHVCRSAGVPIPVCGFR